MICSKSCLGNAVAPTPLRQFPNAQCPMPNAQCPMPNAQCPMPNSIDTPPLG
ncbi:MAG: hypothetical protein F6J93_39610 [Oscillatoria sp. SIO1A7]|nr:hypothetical protein [Oscillatoria sp. SIO1A7]